MLSHQSIWEGIDAVARRHGLSASALAKLAGLDPTAFNPSKRVSKDGRERWPSTESIAKILEATGESFDSFVAATGAYIQPPMASSRTVPLLGLAQAGAGGFFDSAGFPSGQGWDEITLPGVEDGTYALEVQGDSMLPLYREGDKVIVSASEQVRRGDRVAVGTKTGEVMVKILQRQTLNKLELASVNPDFPPRLLDMAEVEWIRRIIWASQ
ncbi:MAG: helix-turn-helix transcriptional regulator [Devosia sp.]|nr:helix-turn-helix transcriptional regulator [Devosia sp.]